MRATITSQNFNYVCLFHDLVSVSLSSHMLLEIDQIFQPAA